MGRLFKRKGFTLIELIVVMAIISVLVLFAVPKFMNYREEAVLTQIKSDIRTIEDSLQAYMMKSSNNKLPEGLEVIDITLLDDAIDGGRLYDYQGGIDSYIGSNFYKITDKLNSKLKGDFVVNEEGKVYYLHNKGKITNKELLIGKVEYAESLNQSDYVSGWEELISQLDNARAMIENEKATQRKVDKAEKNLEDALSKLVRKDSILPPVVTFQPNGNGTPSKSQSIKVSIDVNEPAIIVRSLYAWSNSTSYYEEEGLSIFSSGDTITQSSGDGEYYLHVIVEDNADNIVKLVSNVFILDNTAPIITIEGDTTTPTNQDVTVTASVNEGTLNKTSHTFTTNGSFEFIATDEAGNITKETVTVSNIDKVEPVITIGDYIKTPTNQDITVTATVTKGILNKTSHTFTENGSFTFTATDEAGNEAVPVTVTIDNIDKIAPTTPTLSATPTTPTNGNVTVTVTYSADSATKQYKIGAGSWTSYTAPFTVSSNATVYARGTDSAGNVSTEGSLVISNIDKTAPTVTFSLNGNSTPAKSHSTSVTVSDTGSGVNTREYVWSTSTTTPASGWQTFTDGSTITKSDGAGVHYLHIKATDNAGNTTNTRSNAFVLDNTPPTYVLATDSDFKYVTSSSAPNTYEGGQKGYYKYTGTAEYVAIPHKIKGNEIKDYYKMFEESSVKGVASNNPNVTNMHLMFWSSKATTLDLSSFDTSRVNTMYGMFWMSKATTLDLSSFDTSNVTNMAYMFNFSQATTLDLSSFDTSNVTDMSGMFQNSQATTLDLSSFDTSKVTDMDWMFYNSKATTGYARTQVDANKFNASTNKAAGLNFEVK